MHGKQVRHQILLGYTSRSQAYPDSCYIFSFFILQAISRINSLVFGLCLYFGIVHFNVYGEQVWIVMGYFRIPTKFRFCLHICYLKLILNGRLKWPLINPLVFHGLCVSKMMPLILLLILAIVFTVITSL